MFWLSLQLLPETFLILKIIQGHTIKNVHKSSCKVPLALVRLWPNLNFLDRFSRETPLKYQIPWQSAQWESQCFMRTGGQTDVTTLTVAFRHFCERAWKRNPQVKPLFSRRWERKPASSGKLFFSKVCSGHLATLPWTNIKCLTRRQHGNYRS